MADDDLVRLAATPGQQGELVLRGIQDLRASVAAGTGLTLEPGRPHAPRGQRGYSRTAVTWACTVIAKLDGFISVRTTGRPGHTYEDTADQPGRRDRPVRVSPHDLHIILTRSPRNPTSVDVVAPAKLAGFLPCCVIWKDRLSRPSHRGSWKVQGGKSKNG